jgi:hypothetical protein
MVPGDKNEKDRDRYNRDWDAWCILGVHDPWQ